MSRWTRPPGRPLMSPESLVQVQLPRLRGRRQDERQRGRPRRDRGGVQGSPQRPACSTADVLRPAAARSSSALAAAKQFKGLRSATPSTWATAATADFVVVGFFSADGGPDGKRDLGLPARADERLQPDDVLVRQPAACVRMPTRRRPFDRSKGPPSSSPPRPSRTTGSSSPSSSGCTWPIAGILVAFMCVAAVFSIANTMFSAVAGRTREIAMLRTIGFRRPADSDRLSARGRASVAARRRVGCLACAGVAQACRQHQGHVRRQRRSPRWRSRSA